MTPLASQSMSIPRCHQRARPIEWRRPGSPKCFGRLTESCLAVHSGSSGTGFWMRNQSRPGVECRVQYSRGWSARIWMPERMIKTMNNAIAKCCRSTHHGIPGWARADGEVIVPGYRAMKCCTAGMSRSPWATATATSSTTKPMGSSHKRLNHFSRPTRTRGAIPEEAGRCPAPGHHPATRPVLQPWLLSTCSSPRPAHPPSRSGTDSKARIRQDLGPAPLPAPAFCRGVSACAGTPPSCMRTRAGCSGNRPGQPGDAEQLRSCAYGLPLGLQGLGCEPAMQVLPDPGQRSLVARIQPGCRAPAIRDERKLIVALPSRAHPPWPVRPGSRLAG